MSEILFCVMIDLCNTKVRLVKYTLLVSYSSFHFMNISFQISASVVDISTIKKIDCDVEGDRNRRHHVSIPYCIPVMSEILFCVMWRETGTADTM
jgi:hypothetical protein